MPRPMRVCATPGCPELTAAGCCDRCMAARPARQDDRPTAAVRGYGARWSKYAREYRALHPWCALCALEGRRRKAQAVDHIQPVTGPNDPGFWDPRNHQSICRPCHAVKTQAEGRTRREDVEPVAPTPRRRWAFA